VDSGSLNVSEQNVAVNQLLDVSQVAEAASLVSLAHERHYDHTDSSQGRSCCCSCRKSIPLRSGDALFSRFAHKKEVGALIFSHDGKMLASAVGDSVAEADPDATNRPGEVKVWSIPTGDLLATLREGLKEVVGMAFSPDGKQLATACHDGAMHVWDVAAGKKLHSFSVVKQGIYGLSYNKDGSQLMAVNRFKSVLAWNAATGDPIAGAGKKETTGPIDQAVFSLSGHRLATVASLTGRATVWDIAGQRRLFELGYSNKIIALSFSQNGQYLATSAVDEPVRVWNATNGEEVAQAAKQSRGAFCVALSVDTKQTAFALGASVYLNSITVETPVQFELRGHWSGVQAVSFRPDGKKLATADGDGRLRIWDADAGALALDIRSHRDAIWSVAFSPDGKVLASASEDRTVKIWNVDTGQLLHSFDGHPSGVLAAAFASVPGQLATVCRDRSLHIWDLHSSKKLTSLRLGAGTAKVLAFSPDGAQLAVAHDRTVRILRVADGQESLVLRGHTGDVTALSFSSDGKRLATASDDLSVQVWDSDADAWQKATMNLTLRGHTGGMTAVAFSFDGKRLISGSTDQTVRFWDAATGQQTLVLAGPTGTIAQVALSRDNRRLAASDQKSVVHIWQCPEAEEVDLWEMRARQYAQQKLWANSIAWFEKAVRQRPDDADLHLECGRAHAHAANWDKAGDEFRKAVQLRPKDALLREEIIAEFFRFNKETQLSDFLDRCAELAVDDVSLWMRCGLTHAQAGRIDEATKKLSRAIILRPADADLRGQIMAANYRYNERGPQLRELLDQCAALAPNDPLVFRDRGSWAIRSKKLDIACTDFSRALKLEPNRITLALHISRECSSLSDAELLDFLDRLLGSFPDIPHFWVDRGFAYGRRQEATKGVADVLKGMEMLANDAHQRREVISRLLQDAELLAQVVKRRPNDVELFQVLSDSAIQQNRWSQARMPLEKLFELQPDNVHLARDLAYASWKTRDFKKYKEDCEALLKRFGQTDDSRTAAAVAMSCSLASKPVVDMTEVVRLARKAAKADADNLRFQHVLALALCRAGLHDEAVRILAIDEMGSSSPDRARAQPFALRIKNLLALSLIRQKQGDSARALECIRAAELLWTTPPARLPGQPHPPAPAGNSRPMRISLDLDWRDDLELNELWQEAVSKTGGR
jgi:WD40 repeat protein/tetratricopeptide (TPR) repeat protein